MAYVKSDPGFRDWLKDALEESGKSKRSVARRMAERHPHGVTLETIDTGRRTINKILAGDLTPTQPTRDLIAWALDRDDAPPENRDQDDDEEEEDLESTLQSLARESADLNRRVSRALKAVRS